MTRKLTDDVYTKNSVRLLFRNEFDKTLAVEIRLGSRVGSEGEFPNVILNTSGLEVLLGLSYPCNLGVSVDDGRNTVVVDVTVTRLDVFNSSDAFFLSLVCEHGPKGHVTDTLDVLHRSIELVIDDDPTFVIFLDTNSFQVETLRIWTTTDGNQNDVGFKLRWTRSISLHPRHQSSTHGLLLVALGRLRFDDDFPIYLVG